MGANDWVEPLLHSIAKAERHIRSEYGTRMVGVMDTIGKHPHFAMMQLPGQVTVLSGRDDVDEMYKASVDLAAPQASRILSQLTSDWYMFIENVPTRMWMEDGSLRTVQTVTMFVTDDENGITGEYAWQRNYPSREGGADGAGVPMPDRALENLKLHEDLLCAMCSGDMPAFSDLLDPACIWAQRNYMSDTEGGELDKFESAEAAAGFVAQWHAALKPAHVSILNRRVTDWYVFAEELWVIEPIGGERRQYRAAVVYAVNQAGKLEAALGFGRDIEDLSPSAETKMGIAFWPEGVGPDPSSRTGYPEG